MCAVAGACAGGPPATLGWFLARIWEGGRWKQLTNAGTVAGTPTTGKRIGILVVAYNAESILTSVLARIPSEIMAKIEQVMVFDDASQDETY